MGKNLLKETFFTVRIVEGGDRILDRRGSEFYSTKVAIIRKVLSFTEWNYELAHMKKVKKKTEEVIFYETDD